MEDYLKILSKKYWFVFISCISTYNSVDKSWRVILDKNLSLGSFNRKILPTHKVLISDIIQRTDNAKTSLTSSRLNEYLSDFELDWIDNKKNPIRRFKKEGLHLNSSRYGKMTLNVIRKLNI